MSTSGNLRLAPKISIVFLSKITLVNFTWIGSVVTLIDKCPDTASFMQLGSARPDL